MIAKGGVLFKAEIAGGDFEIKRQLMVFAETRSEAYRKFYQDCEMELANLMPLSYMYISCAGMD